MADIARVTDAQIRALDFSPAELLQAIDRAVGRLRQGDAQLIPKMALHPRCGGEFYAMPATLGSLAVVKWLNVAAAAPPGAPLIQAQLLATHAPSGRTVALMDAQWITAIRTAAVSAHASRALLPQGVQQVAVIGCGLQARTHLAAWRDLFALQGVIAYSRQRASAERLVADTRAQGLRAEVVDSAQEALCSGGLVLVASPANTPTPGTLDARGVKPGTLVVALDLAVAFEPDSLTAFDRIAVDHRGQTGALLQARLIPALPRLDEDSSTLTAMRPHERVLFAPPGTALADAAVAELVLQRLGLWPD